ncbi:condensation domain-containing protein [Micromonospora sp. NPDC005298]|uniref:condensation domain-containing protein n=1 Tax=Micromonospora sp. NPDC005298 TaxID=3156873 RepID=UPI0033B202FE
MTARSDRRSLLLRQLRTTLPTAPAPAGGERAEAPLTGAQSGLWVIDQLDPGSSQYTVPIAYRLHGHLDLDALDRALAAVVARQEALRAVFDADDDEPVQRFQGPTAPLRVVDLSTRPGPDRDRELREVLRSGSEQSFDLASGPLLRVTAVRLTADEHVLLVVTHHIVFDGWSVGVFLRELGACYQAELTGQPVDLPALGGTFGDYARWHQEWLAGEECRRTRDHWLTRLADLPAPVDLATKPRQPYAATPGTPVPVGVDATTATALDETCRRAQVTPFMVLLAAFAVVLSRRTGATDLLIGSPMANRPLPYTRHLIGYFVNLVVLRVDLGGDPTLGELLGRVRDVAVEAYEHQHYPFPELVDHLEPHRDTTVPPMVPVTFVLQDAEREGTADWPGLRIEVEELPVDGTVSDLTVSLAPGPDGLRGEITYRADICDRADIEDLASAFTRAVRKFAGDLDRRIDSLDV